MEWFHLSQQHLIDQILVNPRLNGTNVNRVWHLPHLKNLTWHSDSEPFDSFVQFSLADWEVEWKGNAQGHCVRWSSVCQIGAQWLGRYLLGTPDRGTNMQLMTDKNLEVFSEDASFCDNLTQPPSKDTETGCDTARSQHGYIINYADCPLLLCTSQLQMEVAPSSTESEQ